MSLLLLFKKYVVFIVGGVKWLLNLVYEVNDLCRVGVYYKKMYNGKEMWI